MSLKNLMREELIGLIPAAGKGTRLGLPYPKELYPVVRNCRYQPIAQYSVDNLVQAGVGHVVFVINDSKHQLLSYFGNGQRFGCHLSYVVQEKRERQPAEPSGESTSPGLAHALDAAYHLCRNKTVFFGMADTIVRPRNVFQQLYASAARSDDVLLALFTTKRPEKFGMVSYDHGGQVRTIIDKPQETNLTEMWGCMIWRPSFTEHLHCAIQQQIYDFAKILNSAIREGLHFHGVHFADGHFQDLGTYDEIMELQSELVS
ncbi:MAG TPA: sugar phosphate nucleotidyltransferase [Caldilineaceae bacterium]|nr:sugar phosphate nucleotidyltransferase [Caldilineaceae bacterium]